MENAADLGFMLDDNEKYNEVPYKTLTVNNSIVDLADFAIANGTTYKILRLMNPWLKGKSLTVKPGKTYEIKLPALPNPTIAK